MKVCSRCNIEKRDECFQIMHYKERTYLYSYCKDCQREYATERRRKKGIRPLKRKAESIPETKVCSRCQSEKPKTDFRIRTDKRSEPAFTYLNNTCMKCDADIQRERHRRQRATAEGRQKHNDQAKTFHRRHREKVLSIGKQKRQTPEYKEKMRAYRKRNKDKIHNQEVVTKKRYHEKHRDNVTDEYVIRQLITQGVATRDSLRSHPELIEAKRIQILIKRQINSNAD
jgi:hypothetical protein